MHEDQGVFCCGSLNNTRRQELARERVEDRRLADVRTPLHANENRQVLGGAELEPALR